MQLIPVKYIQEMLFSAILSYVDIVSVNNLSYLFQVLSMDHRVNDL